MVPTCVSPNRAAYPLKHVYALKARTHIVNAATVRARRMSRPSFWMDAAGASVQVAVGHAANTLVQGLEQHPPGVL